MYRALYPYGVPRFAPRWLLMSALAALHVAVSPDAAAALQERDCGDRASLAIAIRDESGLVPMPGATVVLRWTDAVRRPVRKAADSEGRLLLCVPRDARQATLWAEFGDASSEEALVTLDPGMAHEVELRLLFGEMRTGRLVGLVRDARTHRPVAAAEVSVAHRAEVTGSNRRGLFVLSGLPVGEHELSVRHLGYAPLTHPVTVTRGLTTEVEIGLSPDPVELEPLVATATRPRRLEIKGFYERKYWGELSGGGTFFTAEDIARRNPVRITHMIADAPGVRLAGCTLRGYSCKLYSSRGATGFAGGGCLMNVYLDGSLVVRESDQRWYGGTGSINDFVLPVEIGGIEVYRGAGSLPAEFSGSDSRCGAIVIWTR
ncbi:carboxypeptidase regulatory-like domain-containing protein [Candidatus Palauibacter sp.]|uniref:carboxypeptidase regulatory-like domain-containing protein n=1 Tax=Candidatus Palauibacter sp. TaxID=3101350 RepID=UPI003AF23E60